MIKQKLITSALTAAVVISGATIGIEKFQHTKLEEIKTNFQKTETILKENEQKLTDKYQQLYNTAKTSIQTLEAENQKLKEQLANNTKPSNTENIQTENTEIENTEIENTEIENTEIEQIE